MPEENFEEFWDAVRPTNAIVVVNDKATDLKGQLLLASEKTRYELAQRFQKFDGEALTTEVLSKIISDGVKTFMEKWFEGLRNQDTSGLIEIVLEGQRLPPAEIQGFVQALPRSLLDRILKSAIASGTGIHALVALEKYRREGRQDYTIETINGQVQVRFTPPGRGEITFGLYEQFDLEERQDASRLVNT